MERPPNRGRRRDLPADLRRSLHGYAHHLTCHLATKHLYDDLVQYGALGLLEAERRYRPCIGAFAPYAKRRMKGAMVDGLRQMLPFSRRTYQHLKRALEANAASVDTSAVARFAEGQVEAATAEWGGRQDHSPEDLLAEKRDIEQLRAALGTLEKADQVFIEGAYEIGEGEPATSTGSGSVRFRTKQRIFGTLRQLLEREGFNG